MNEVIHIDGSDDITRIVSVSPGVKEEILVTQSERNEEINVIEDKHQVTLIEHRADRSVRTTYPDGRTVIEHA